MCYTGCRPGCENCKPKYVYCAKCGRRNGLRSSECGGCGALISDEQKDEAKRAWKESHRVDIQRPAPKAPRQ